MIGVVVVTHRSLAKALLECCEQVLGKVPAAAAVAIESNDNHAAAQERIGNAIAELGADGVLLLTDLFGGTASNVGLTLLEPERVEVVSGVNLPMLLHALTARDRSRSLHELAASAAQSGRKNIVVAGELLETEAAPSP